MTNQHCDGPRPSEPLAPRPRLVAVEHVETSAGEAAEGLAAVLKIELAARDSVTLGELRQLVANETRKVCRARQIFVAELSRRGTPSISTVSSVATVDAQSFLIDGIRRLLTNLGRERGHVEPVTFALPAFCDPNGGLAETYPFREFAWLPLKDRRGRPFAGLLLARETPWQKDDLVVVERLAATFAHAWRELATASSFRPRRFHDARYALALPVAMLAVLAVPVPITALAPVEIVAREPFVVSAPIDGVIEEVLVEPSAAVKAGDVLVRYSDTGLRNRAVLAERDVRVAAAKLRQMTNLAFSDARGRHELGVAEAEHELKKAELDYARDLLAKTVLMAGRDGIAVFPDRRTLIGKPVVTGERIMEIATPGEVEARIDLAVPDAIALRSDSAVTLYLDVDPLQPWSAHVVRSDYRARPSDGDILAFRTFAALDAGDRPPPRLGLRGTAQVYGDRMPLGLTLLRRPISAFRQWAGL